MPTVQFTMSTNPSKSTGNSSGSTGNPSRHKAHAGGKKAPKLLIKVDWDIEEVLTEKQYRKRKRKEKAEEKRRKQEEEAGPSTKQEEEVDTSTIQEEDEDSAWTDSS